MLTNNLSPRNVVQNRPKSKSQRFLLQPYAFQNKDNNTKTDAKAGKLADATATAAASEVVTRPKNDLIAPQTNISKQTRNTKETETIRKPGFLGGVGKSSVASTGMTSALKGRKGEHFNSALYKSTPGPLPTKVQKNPSFLQIPSGKSSTQQLALHKKN